MRRFALDWLVSLFYVRRGIRSRFALPCLASLSGYALDQGVWDWGIRRGECVKGVMGYAKVEGRRGGFGGPA